MSDKKEIWKDIDGYDGDYQVSTFGRVKSFKFDKVNGKILNLGMFKAGYYYVTLYKIKQSKKYTIHRLVALAFIPNPDNLLEVDHIDKNKLNNHVLNLRWVSRSIQMRNRKPTGTINIIGLVYNERKNRSPHIRANYRNKEGKLIRKCFTINQKPIYKNAKKGQRGFCYPTREAAEEAAKKWLKETRNKEFVGVY
jgi:hypothetical protein